MDLVVRLLGLQFTVYFGPEETVEAESAAHLGAADLSFGFGPDPLVEPYWTDDIDG